MIEATLPEVQPTAPPMVRVSPSKQRSNRRPSGPVCEKGFQVVDSYGEEAITDDDLFKCLDLMKRLPTGAKLNRQDGVLLAFTTKPRIHPEERKQPIVFKKR